MSNVKKQARDLLNATEKKEFEALETTASKVRYLLAKNHSRGDIARYMNIRYQWVNNIMNQPLKRS